MTITINGVTIGDAAIEAEATHHAGCPDPRAAAACALAIRELLIQRAKAAAIETEGDVANDGAADALIERLLEREAPVPRPTEAECRRFYEQHIDRYTAGELVEAAHILFAVTPNAPVDAIRRQAESTLRQAVAEPGRFAELAQGFSNCPSGAQGGNLGQIQRGETVPEFEREIFGAAPGVLPRLVNTRYGFHVVLVARTIAGRALDFEIVRPRIAETLSQRVRAKAAEQYVRILASKASISGVDLGAAATPLVQ